MGLFDFAYDIYDCFLYGWKVYSWRLESFEEKGKINSKFSPREFAKAGLFRTGKSDECECFHCGNNICGWEYDDDPKEKHANQSLHCSYIKPRIQLEGVMRILADVEMYEDSEDKDADLTKTERKAAKGIISRLYKMLLEVPFLDDVKVNDDSEEKVADRTETYVKAAGDIVQRLSTMLLEVLFLDDVMVNDDSEEKVADRTETYVKAATGIIERLYKMLFEVLNDDKVNADSEEKVADRTETYVKVNRYEGISSSARKVPMRNTVLYNFEKYDDFEEKVVYLTETDGKVVQAEDKLTCGSVEVVKIKSPTVLPERSFRCGFYLVEKPRKIGDKFDSGPDQGGGYKFAKSPMTEGEMFMEGTVFNYRSDVIIKSGMNEAPYGIQVSQTESSCKSAEYSRDGYVWDLFGNSTLQKIRAEQNVLCDNYWKGQTVVPLGDVVADSAPKQSGPYDEDTEEEIRALEQLLMCKVCLDKDSCIVFFPCRHMATCDACERFLQRCPVCRSAIDEAVKINEE